MTWISPIMKLYPDVDANQRVEGEPFPDASEYSNASYKYFLGRMAMYYYEVVNGCMGFPPGKRCWPQVASLPPEHVSEKYETFEFILSFSKTSYTSITRCTFTFLRSISSMDNVFDTGKTNPSVSSSPSFARS